MFLPGLRGRAGKTAVKIGPAPAYFGKRPGESAAEEVQLAGKISADSSLPVGGTVVNCHASSDYLECRRATRKISAGLSGLIAKENRINDSITITRSFRGSGYVPNLHIPDRGSKRSGPDRENSLDKYGNGYFKL